CTACRIWPSSGPSSVAPRSALNTAMHHCLCLLKCRPLSVLGTSLTSAARLRFLAALFARTYRDCGHISQKPPELLALAASSPTPSLIPSVPDESLTCPQALANS